MKQRKATAKEYYRASKESYKIADRVESDIEKAAKEKQQFFEHKLEAFEKDRMAVVPLEKERFKVSFIQNAVIQNINKYRNSFYTWLRKKGVPCY